MMDIALLEERVKAANAYIDKKIMQARTNNRR